MPAPEDEEGVVDLLDSDEEEGAGEQDPAGSDEQAQASFSAEQSQVHQAHTISFGHWMCADLPWLHSS